MNVNFASVATIPLPENTEAVIIRPGPDQRFSDEEFAQFCAQYPELRIEMSSDRIRSAQRRQTLPGRLLDSARALGCSVR